MKCMQAAEGTAAKRPEAAAASGRTLLNLRARDAEGGLLGRTLLTLVSNKARRLRHGILAHATHDGLLHCMQIDICAVFADQAQADQNYCHA